MAKKASRKVRSASQSRSKRGTGAPGLAALSALDLHRELRRRQRGVKALRARRARVLAKLEAIDAEIRASGGHPNGAAPGRVRPKNEVSLPAALRNVLNGKTMSVAEAADAVRKAGYQTSSANFRTMVAIALAKNGFKRVERGRYTAA